MSSTEKSETSSNMAENTIPPTATCTRCRRPQANAEELQNCDKCQAAYCSTDCLKADKKKHRKYCRQRAEGGNSNSGSGIDHNVKGLEAPNDQPFTRLERGKYLHRRPRGDVFRLLIDCYRLRVDDNLKLERIAPPASLADGFQQFLDMAAQRPALLPAWWDEAAAVQCKASGTEGGAGWYSLGLQVNKHQVNEYYGNAFMAVQLRLLGEVIYQRGPRGKDGKAICAALAQKEREGALMAVIGF